MTATTPNGTPNSYLTLSAVRVLRPQPDRTSTGDLLPSDRVAAALIERELDVVDILRALGATRWAEHRLDALFDYVLGARP